MTLDEILERGDVACCRVNGNGLAHRCLGADETEGPETEWDGCLVRTGRVLMVAIGDDYVYSVDPANVRPLDRDWCPSCGQIGCMAYR